MSRTQIRVWLILMSTFVMGLMVSAQEPKVIQQLGELTASDGTAYDALGFSVAVAGNTVAAGGDFTNIGAVYVYLKPLSGWGNATQVAKLTASDAGQLGDSVAISGDENTIVAGDPRNGRNRGAVYVFVKPASGWKDMTETAKLTASDGQDQDMLGTAVAISGNTVVAGAPANPDVQVHGKAYVFVKPMSGWTNRTQNAEFSASDGKNNDFFGNSISISSNTVVVGAPQRQIGAGAAYVFVKPVGGWKNMHETAELTASDGVINDGLGTSVSISGDTVAAGAPAARSAHGVVYVFVKPANGWIDSTQTAELTSKQGADPETLGESVSVNGNTIVAGAPLLHTQMGLAFMFVKPVSGWRDGTETRKLKATNGHMHDLFGYSVSATRNTIVIGAPGVAPGGQRLEGAVYVFGK